MEITRVDVTTKGGTYPIVLGQGVRDKIASFLEECLGQRPLAIVTDRHLAKLWLEPLYARLIKDSPKKPKLIVVPAGERAKTLDVYASVAQKLLYFGADRGWALVAFGGGVVGDLAGFVAATYQRGVPFVMVPTTLLAGVDASIGGKVAIDLKQAKNALGAFWQPSGVLIDTEYLSTLPKREYVAGLAEVLKYGMIQDEPFFEFIVSNAQALLRMDSDAMAKVIQASILHKKAIVEQDEREANLRAVLNFGHTFGHAFEAHAHYKTFLHGEAVGLGMLVEAAVAYRIGSATKDAYARVKESLKALGLPTKPPSIHPDRMKRLLSLDKKKQGAKVRFVLLDRIGSVRIEPIAIEELVDLWKTLRTEGLP